MKKPIEESVPSLTLDDINRLEEKYGMLAFARVLESPPYSKVTTDLQLGWGITKGHAVLAGKYVGKNTDMIVCILFDGDYIYYLEGKGD